MNADRARDERIIRAALSWIDVYAGVDALAALDEGDPAEAYDYIIASADVCTCEITYDDSDSSAHIDPTACVYSGHYEPSLADLAAMSVDERRVRAAAAQVYKPEGVDIWYDAPNRSLNNATPRQFVEAGDAGRVLQVLDQLISGSYG